MKFGFSGAGGGANSIIFELIQREYHPLRTHTATLFPPFNAHTALTLSVIFLVFLETIVWCGIKRGGSDTYIQFHCTHAVKLTHMYHT